MPPIKTFAAIVAAAWLSACAFILPSEHEQTKNAEGGFTALSSTFQALHEQTREELVTEATLAEVVDLSGAEWVGYSDFSEVITDFNAQERYARIRTFCNAVDNGDSCYGYLFEDGDRKSPVVGNAALYFLGCRKVTENHEWKIKTFVVLTPQGNVVMVDRLRATEDKVWTKTEKEPLCFLSKTLESIPDNMTKPFMPF